MYKRQDQIFELAIESGAKECISNHSFHEVHCEKNEIYNIKNKLETKIKNFISTEIEWKSLNTKIISKDKLETTIGFLETLEEEDDIQSVYTNFKVENN